MSRTHVQLWYNQFKEAREDVNDNARPGRPSSSTTDENIEPRKTNQSPIIPMEESRRTKAEKTMSKLGQMRRFCSLFYSIAMAWYFLPQGRMVNRKYYLKVMCRLSETILQKRSELWKNQS